MITENMSLNDNVGSILEKAFNDGLNISATVSVVKTKVDGTKEVICDNESNLLTNNGRDFIINQVYANITAGTRGANFLALSTSSTAVSATDTAFANEINSSGLARVDLNSASTGSITHTNGTNTVVLSNIFTATGTVSNIRNAALFNSAIATTPYHAFTFSSPTSLSTNERLTISWTISIS